jgi:RNA polymerase sigma factor (sigma-70 family)
MANDATGAWLAAAGRVPLLTPAEEIHLATAVRAWLDAPDPSAAVRRRGLRARDRMTAANLRLVVSVAKKYASSAERVGLGFEDLLQIGAVGLVRGVELFDHTRGYKLSTYAYFWIRQGLQRAVASGGVIKIPTNVNDKLRRLQPGDIEGMSDRERIKLAAAAAALKVVSLDAPAGDGEGGTLLDLIA